MYVEAEITQLTPLLDPILEVIKDGLSGVPIDYIRERLQSESLYGGASDWHRCKVGVSRDDLMEALRSEPAHLKDTPFFQFITQPRMTVRAFNVFSGVFDVVLALLTVESGTGLELLNDLGLMRASKAEGPLGVSLLDATCRYRFRQRCSWAICLALCSNLHGYALPAHFPHSGSSPVYRQLYKSLSAFSIYAESNGTEEGVTWRVSTVESPSRPVELEFRKPDCVNLRCAFGCCSPLLFEVMRCRRDRNVWFMIGTLRTVDGKHLYIFRRKTVNARNAGLKDLHEQGAADAVRRPYMQVDTYDVGSKNDYVYKAGDVRVHRAAPCIEGFDEGLRLLSESIEAPDGTTVHGAFHSMFPEQTRPCDTLRLQCLQSLYRKYGVSFFRSRAFCMLGLRAPLGSVLHSAITLFLMNELGSQGLKAASFRSHCGKMPYVGRDFPASWETRGAWGDAFMYLLWHGVIS